MRLLLAEEDRAAQLTDAGRIRVLGADPEREPSVLERVRKHEQAGVIVESCDDRYPCLQPELYALDSFLAVVDLHQEQYWAPDAGTTAGEVVRWVLPALTLFGWLLVGLVIVGAAERLRDR